MHISSRTLLIMVIGNLQFPNSTLLGFKTQKEKDEFFEEMTSKRVTVSNDLLCKFAVHYTQHIFAWFGGIEHIKIDFPTEQNRDEWQQFFKMQPDGSFICKKSRLHNLWFEWYCLQACYAMNSMWIRYPLRLTLADVA